MKERSTDGILGFLHEPTVLKLRSFSVTLRNIHSVFVEDSNLLFGVKQVINAHHHEVTNSNVAQPGGDARVCFGTISGEPGHTVTLWFLFLQKPFHLVSAQLIPGSRRAD